MEAKYIQAIKAGVIGGVILAVCMLVRLFIDIINTNNASSYVSGIYNPGIMTGLAGLGLVSCCVFLVEIVVILGTGALAVMMAKSLIVKMDEAFVVGAVAGAVAGLFGTVIQVLGAIVTPWLTHATYMDYYYSYGSGILSTLGGVGISILCCGPVLIIVGAILAGIGGAIYAAVVLKIK